MLHGKIRQDLLDTRKRLIAENELLTAAQLQTYYATFREKFGPEILKSLDGEALLNYMHSLRESNRETLVYWLEFKNDEEFPGGHFGSISGGSALKFIIYQRANDGAWMTGSPRDQREITVDEAIDYARRHREQLVKGAELLQALPDNATYADYKQLQVDMDTVAPDVSRLAWGHKYFSLLYPTKLDDYHNSEFQRFYLVKLLQNNIPSEAEGRYAAANRFVAVAGELRIPMNHLTSALNALHGKPIRYWRIIANYKRLPDWQNWEMMRDGGFVAVGWHEIGDLSHIHYKQESKNQIRALMKEKYQDPGRWGQEIFHFVTIVNENDIVLAFEGERVLGIGRVTGEYYYEPSSPAPHRRPVIWLSDDEWQLPHEEGSGSVVRAIKSYDNLVEIEQRILGNPVEGIASVRSSKSVQSAPIRLSGIPGQIQAVLMRKGQVILHGPPGTGKTYWAEITAQELASRAVFEQSFDTLSEEQRNQITGRYVRMCSFHPAYGYEDFLEGYRPRIVDDQMAFVRQDGIFKQICEDSRVEATRGFYLIIDEINRGDIPRIFGELLTVLEKDKREKSILLPLSNEPFSVPQNVYIIGTMNTADRSIALLDTALRRRFGFIELMPDILTLQETTVKGIPLGLWLEALNRRILENIGRDARNLQIGHAYLLEDERPVSDFARFARIVQEDIIPLLEEYCYEDYATLEKILGRSFVNVNGQRIHHELFDPANEDKLIQALLALTPEIITSMQATEAEQDETEDIDNGDDLSEDDE